MLRRRPYHIALVLLALFLLGTVLVLSTVSFYLRINPDAYLTEQDIINDNANNLSVVVPRILHQTWKTDVLPERWTGVSQGCRDLMPNYEYMLWTDESSRTFIATHYPWFLTTFDAYTYPIQRADAIRYFVLHHYGGVYFDLDIGCTKSLDPLLIYPILLPKTIPVGVSNDLMFAQPKHPFMEQTIHNLVTFDHSWILNYPTVMFSTGPMFLSAQYGLYASRPGHDHHIRILPKSLYGKNAKPEEAPHSFFTHYYGSSWHADDAGFITFLGKWGQLLMWLGLAILVVGLVRLLWSRRTSKPSLMRRRLLIGRYDIILPRVIHRNGHFNIDLGSFSLSATASSADNTQPSSPNTTASTFSNPSSPTSPDAAVPLLPLFDSDASVTDITDPQSPTVGTSSAATSRAIRSAKAWVRSISRDNSSPRNRFKKPTVSRRDRSTLFFLPAIFTPSSSTPTVRLHDQDDVDVPFLNSPSSPSTRKFDFREDVREEDFDLPPELDEEDISNTGAELRPPTTNRSLPLSRSPSFSSTSRYQSTIPPALDLSPATIAAPPPYQHSPPPSAVRPHTPTLQSPASRLSRVQSPPHSAWSNAWGEWEGEEPPPTP